MRVSVIARRRLLNTKPPRSVPDMPALARSTSNGFYRIAAASSDDAPSVRFSCAVYMKSRPSDTLPFGRCHVEPPSQHSQLCFNRISRTTLSQTISVPACQLGLIGESDRCRRSFVDLGSRARSNCVGGVWSAPDVCNKPLGSERLKLRQL